MLAGRLEERCCSAARRFRNRCSRARPGLPASRGTSRLTLRPPVQRPRPSTYPLHPEREGLISQFHTTSLLSKSRAVRRAGEAAFAEVPKSLFWTLDTGPLLCSIGIRNRARLHELARWQDGKMATQAGTSCKYSTAQYSIRSTRLLLAVQSAISIQ
ncbi:hypothetical protein L207DRAFT_108124 [Hyaloscypha variabilis F]|uniref:Uncharacterized protein n=1 Tax=Hyaloscypha variabilis (strain UAMH 11265 / GT02V1 / F) TaxID=1149755 RepID=A0A2J6R9I2_HYAVF|nr:hypothetical protein L207DRAFT_108124 [Hyaloscypha variabilis F]